MATTRTIETIDELKELVGQELGAGASFEVTQERVDAFADVTGDHQWIHVDPARAAATPFGGTIAHGFLTLSMMSLLRQGWEGYTIDLHPKMGINYGLNRVRFIWRRCAWASGFACARSCSASTTWRPTPTR